MTAEEIKTARAEVVRQWIAHYGLACGAPSDTIREIADIAANRVEMMNDTAYRAIRTGVNKLDELADASGWWSTAPGQP